MWKRPRDDNEEDNHHAPHSKRNKKDQAFQDSHAIEVQRFYKRQRRHRQHRMPKKRLIEKYLIKVVRGGGMPSDQNHQHNVELGKNDPQQEGSSPSTRESTGDMTSPETQRDQDPSPPQRS
ncbi:uncharacterized protein LOC101839355 isoform X7 [Mesocricetus auratus]|uniref:Uncharacterized protein LOC101839355 isoform X6 n=1 Tax=Mesocricetus auratus TaxID=10036 RepID=A0ABM2XAP9_MESAU|nr:uncharacterized protein LOC101839355 isoform X6 [Mesocricetus auratus]XP_040599915.1 uncharacterized protein LOC101839355 isoform X7 [Mesocricetus auratus]